MKRSFKIGTKKISLNEIARWEGDGEGLIVSEFHGISSLHTVYLNYGDMSYTYISSAEGGSYDGLKKAAKMTQVLPTWTPRNAKKFPLAQMEAWKAATDHAMFKAFTEVARESDQILTPKFWGEEVEPVNDRWVDSPLVNALNDGATAKFGIEKELGITEKEYDTRIAAFEFYDRLNSKQQEQVDALDTIVRDNYYYQRSTGVTHGAALRFVIAVDKRDNE